MTTAAKEGFCSIEEALEELRQGRMIVLVDDEHRENEGDLVVAAEHATPQAINFMLTHGRGILCLALSEGICDRLHLHPQSAVNNSRGTHGTRADSESGQAPPSRGLNGRPAPREKQAARGPATRW